MCLLLYHSSWEHSPSRGGFIDPDSRNGPKVPGEWRVYRQNLNNRSSIMYKIPSLEKR